MIVVKQQPTVEVREKVAADAYLKFLQSKGADTKILYMRSMCLDKLMPILATKEQTRPEFSNALETVLKKTPDEERSNILGTAREYYPFWMDDIKAIAMFEAYYSCNIEETKWQPQHQTLQSITDTLGKTILSKRESQSLNAYIDAISMLGVNQSVIDTRRKFAKIILLRLRDAPAESPAIYRISVDATLPLFQVKEIKQLYLDVVREFYYFWINDPDAENKVFGKPS